MSDYVEVPRCGFRTGIKILSGDTGETIVVDEYIANLEAENARLRAALENISEPKSVSQYVNQADMIMTMVSIAKAALSATEEDDRCLPIKIKPTHWMPLPAPPTDNAT